MKFLKNKKFLVALCFLTLFICALVLRVYFYLSHQLEKFKSKVETKKIEQPKPGFSHMSPEQIEQILESMTPKNTTTATSSK